MKRIKTGDEVIIIAGKSKGHIGKVQKVTDDKVYVEGGNMITKHIKPNPNKPEIRSGLVQMEAPLHISNVGLYNSATKRADKVGFKFLQDGGIKKKVRYFKSNDEIIDRL